MATSGNLCVRSQVEDYKMRGVELENFSFLQFVQDTWEDDCSPTAFNTNPKTVGGTGHAGRPPHTRSQYLPAHPKFKKRVRVIRAAGHNTLPNILGPFIERGDRSETYDLHCASILALLKPWRAVSDLLLPGCTWPSALASFKSSATRRELQIISGVDFHYQSKEAALDDSQLDGIGNITVSNTNPTEPDSEATDMQGDDALEAVILGMESHRPARIPGEVFHGQLAVELGRKSGLLHATRPTTWDLADEPLERSTRAEHLQQVECWKSALAMEAAKCRAARSEPDLPIANEPMAGAGVTLYSSQQDGSSVHPVPKISHSELPCINIDRLNSDQRRAYNLVQRHFLAHDSATPLPQLLMQIQGEGGTGKSTVIRAISELFKAHGVKHKLFRAAPTGIATSLIDGSTIHTLCHMGVRHASTSNVSDKVIQALRKTWKDVRYLIIDEISMVSRAFLARISDRLCVAKEVEDSDTLFGGINVILAGDFHQFPPVAGGASAALYWPCNPSRDSHGSLLGRKIYEQFRTVVILTEQCRTKDPIWQTLLRHVRHGMCTSEHIAILRSLIVSAPTSATGSNNVQGDQWQDAILVTPRHEVRMQWNKEANRRHCQRNKKQLFISPAEDTYCGRALTDGEKHSLSAGKRSSASRDELLPGKNGLLEELELAVGMQVMITTNVETELDMSNGSRGTVERIIFDRRENLAAKNDAIVRLSFPPECVLVKLDRQTGIQIPGLEKNVVPIVPFERRYVITAGRGESCKTKSIIRRQIPLTSAYAFTDYRSQGQTMDAAIVDIARPPTGSITPFNAYVALSRSSGRDTIRLLRDFDETLFTKTPCNKLAAEDKRLRTLNTETLQEYIKNQDKYQCNSKSCVLSTRSLANFFCQVVP